MLNTITINLINMATHKCQILELLSKITYSNHNIKQIKPTPAVNQPKRLSRFLILQKHVLNHQ